MDQAGAPAEQRLDMGLAVLARAEGNELALLVEIETDLLAACRAA
jgi:hypothetical protein